MTKTQLFYAWACETISNAEFKQLLSRHHECTVDLRQADAGNWIDIVHIASGEVETIYC